MKSATTSVSTESVLSDPYHPTVRLSLSSVTRIFPKSLSVMGLNRFQLDEFESDSDSDYDETELEEIVELRNSLTRSERQIKASMIQDL